MKINYWDCDYSSADEINMGRDSDYDMVWCYGCTHPNNDKSVCLYDNQWGGTEEECKFLISPDIARLLR